MSVKVARGKVVKIRQQEKRYALLLDSEGKECWYNSFGRAAFSDSEEPIKEGMMIEVTYKETPQDGKVWKNVIKVLPFDDEVTNEPWPDDEPKQSSTKTTQLREQWVKEIAMELFKHVVELKVAVNQDTYTLNKKFVKDVFEELCHVVNEASIEQEVVDTDRATRSVDKQNEPV